MSVSIYLGRKIILAIFFWVRATQPKHRHWPTWVSPPLPAQFLPKWPRDHASRSSPCTWTCLRLYPTGVCRQSTNLTNFFLDQLTLHDFGVLSAGPCYDIENIALDDGYAKLGSEWRALTRYCLTVVFSSTSKHRII